MIRYRVRDGLTHLYPYTTQPIFASAGYVVMLPTDTCLMRDRDADFATIRDCDSISTSTSTNFAGDHECFHSKVEAVVNGKVSVAASLRDIRFGWFPGTYKDPSTRAIYRYRSSSGSGPTINQVQPPGEQLACMLGPSILSEASAICEITPTQYPTGPTFANEYRKFYQVADNSYALVKAAAVVRNKINGTPESGQLVWSMEYFFPTYPTSSQWCYTSRVINGSQTADVTKSIAYFACPEAYWSAAIQQALSCLYRTAAPLPTCRRTFFPGRFKILEACVAGLTPSFAHQVADILRTNKEQTLDSMEPLGKHVWSDLCVKCIQNCQELNINSLAYAKDLVGLKEEVKSLKTLALGYKRPKTYLKAFLEYEYGARLTVADTKKLVSATRGLLASVATWSKNYSVVKAAYSDSGTSNFRYLFGCTRTIHYKVYYNPADSLVLKSIKALMDWDAWPTLQNDWDFIPLSFTVDWFVGVGDLCDRLDASIYSQYLDVLSVLTSEKIVANIGFDAPLIGIPDFRATVTQYSRTYKPQLDLPSFYLDTTDGILNHIPEASAIFAIKSR